MYRQLTVCAVIPALNEERAIGLVVSDLRRLRNERGDALIDHVVVCDNGSTDQTTAKARDAGATVVWEARPGYGRACQRAIAALPVCDVVLFVDGDRSCLVDQSLRLLQGIADGADLSIGSRALGHCAPGALTPPQRFGNWLASKLIRVLWGDRVTDLGPFRAIRCTALHRL
ncbi:MAG: glycosyltransferase family 2 protein, partial [Pseudomonadota bacterium]